MNTVLPRRGFLAGSLALAAAPFAAADEPVGNKKQIYELRIYQINAGAALDRANAYFQNALLPALGRAGAGTVGVFEEMKSPSPVVYVLIPFASIDAVTALGPALERDEEYQKAGAEFLGAPPKDPAYTNLETRLMQSTEFMPTLVPPEKKETRVFELRRYRNPSDPALLKKLEMFGKGGEVAIFNRVGLIPVFFSHMLCGPDMPNVTYMLTFPDIEAKSKSWGAFGKDPDWQKLKTTPGYTDAEIIAGIKSIMLKPMAYSQI